MEEPATPQVSGGDGTATGRRTELRLLAGATFGAALVVLASLALPTKDVLLHLVLTAVYAAAGMGLTRGARGAATVVSWVSGFMALLLGLTVLSELASPYPSLFLPYSLAAMALFCLLLALALAALAKTRPSKPGAPH